MAMSSNVYRSRVTRASATWYAARFHRRRTYQGLLLIWALLKSSQACLPELILLASASPSLRFFHIFRPSLRIRCPKSLTFKRERRNLKSFRRKYSLFTSCPSAVKVFTFSTRSICRTIWMSVAKRFDFTFDSKNAIGKPRRCRSFRKAIDSCALSSQWK